MPEVTQTDPDGLDYGWVMQVTFVATIVVGAPLVAVISVFIPHLSTWSERAMFAVRMGAVVWIVTALLTYWYARRTHV